MPRGRAARAEGVASDAAKSKNGMAEAQSQVRVRAVAACILAHIMSILRLFPLRRSSVQSFIFECHVLCSKKRRLARRKSDRRGVGLCRRLT